MIEIFISPPENLGLVWNADDWLKLRQDYRIVGDLIGSLSKYPRQSSSNGLPLCLQPEEVTLLKEKGYAKLVNCPSLSLRPDDELRCEFEEKEKQFHESERKEYIRKKEIEVERSYDCIMEGKHQKHEDFHSQSSNKRVVIEEEVNKIQNVSSKQFLSCIPIDDPWLNEQLKLESIWTYPNSEKETIKYEIFKDLWERNFYITSGIKFGGDFLCYSGDPAKFHAEFIIICMKSEEKLSMKDLVTFGRIGSSTKKTVALATKLEGNIFYQSLQWIETN